MKQWTKQHDWQRGEDRRCRRAPSMSLVGAFARCALLTTNPVGIGAGPPGNS